MPRERGDRGLRIGDLQYVDKPLDLGMLDGNRFGIVLRDVQAPSMDVITSALTTLRSTGFINFYGMQRFGNSSVPTHLVGLALLRTEWKEAARLILHPRDGDSPDIIEARKLWTEKRDARRALDQLPRWLVGERCRESLLTPSFAALCSSSAVLLPSARHLMQSSSTTCVTATPTRWQRCRRSRRTSG